eukprot:189508-Alexandrium_andersonii.AAC.1
METQAPTCHCPWSRAARATRSLTTAPVGQCSARREPRSAPGVCALADLALRFAGTACHWAPSGS